MNTEEVAKKMKGYIDRLFNLFIERNATYAGSGHWAGNFTRNAKLNEILRLPEIMHKPYGQALYFVTTKLDRLINELVELERTGIKPKRGEDHIDDMMVYLFITRQLLLERDLIKEDNPNE